VISHGHYDHLGAVKALKELTGAKVFIGKEDATYADGTEDLTWAKELGAEYYEAFTPDVLISHNDVIELGNTKILCKDVPGHTPGTKAFFFDVTDGEKTLRAAMHGGVGMNSMQKSFLERYNLSTDIREKFVPSIEEIIDEKANDTYKLYKIIQVLDDEDFIKLVDDFFCKKHEKEKWER
jgi:metallo-beta-lactamase class B